MWGKYLSSLDCCRLKLAVSLGLLDGAGFFALFFIQLFFIKSLISEVCTYSVKSDDRSDAQVETASSRFPTYPTNSHL